MANAATGSSDPSCALLSQLRTIMEGTATASADERYGHLLGAFLATGPAGINSLLAVPEQLSLA